MLHLALLVLPACAPLPQTSPHVVTVRPVDLRCEALTEPLCIGERRPHLSFKLEPSDPAARGHRMTSWQVNAGRQPTGRDLWDSGRVIASDPTAIEWNGSELTSGTQVYWRVRTWDESGFVGPWSDPASFRTGLFEESDWSAQWIGWDARLAKTQRPLGFEGAQWIGLPSDEPTGAPSETRYYRATFDVPRDAALASARLVVTADNQLSIQVNGRPIDLAPDEAKDWHRSKEIDLTASLEPGSNVLACAVQNTDSGPTGLVAKLVLRSASGEEHVLVSGPEWKVTAAPDPRWAQRDFVAGADWAPARSYGAYPVGPWGEVRAAGLFLPPPCLLRGSSVVSEKPVRRALLYASALGIYDLYLNGARVNDDFFLPGWTDYEKRIPYHAWDVTQALLPGENALAAVLADGWYAGYIGYGHAREHYGDRTRFLAQLVIEYQDGTRQVSGTGTEWRASLGPWHEADFLMGESYDAREEIAGWNRVGFDASQWAPVDVGAPFPAHLKPHPGPPVRVFADLASVSRRALPNGAWLFDLGQNFAGVVRLRVKGEAGQKIMLRYGERLDADGALYTVNLRGARATDTYVCRGGGEIEEWTPRFTFHGFQYVELSGITGEPLPDAVVGLALSSDAPLTTSFECSDPRITKLVQNAYWTQRANFIDVPTDCPQRDERLGWTGDAQAYLRTATMLCDVQAFFRKWLVDLEDAQRADGQFPMVAPLKVAGGDGGPAWADAGIICPWTIWEIYGDRRDLGRRYRSMHNFVEFTRARSTSELLPPEKFHCFGDWLNVDDPTPNEVIYSAYFVAAAQRLSWASGVLGKTDEAAQYGELAKATAEAFRKAYVGDDGKIRGDSQTAYVLALAYDIVEGEAAALASTRLIQKLEERDWHLSTGFVGTKDLMLVLSKIGRNDVAYRLLENDTYPSWLFELKQGATSIWERWNGWTPEKGFEDPGMNSFAHYAFGAVVQWIMENVGGIRAISPGYANIKIRPQPGGHLTWAKTRYDSPRGPIETSWRLDGTRFLLDLTIPPSTYGRLYLPTRRPDSILEGGQPLSAVPSARLLESTEEETLLEILPGTYSFSVEDVVIRSM
jgi:alpha-L-rhamnosidase